MYYKAQAMFLFNNFCIFIKKWYIHSYRLYRLTVRTRPFQGWNRGSIPRRVTILIHRFDFKVFVMLFNNQIKNMEKLIQSELYQDEKVLWCSVVKNNYSSYIVTTHRVIITYFHNRSAHGSNVGSNIEKSIVFSPNIKEKPKLKNPELGNFKCVNWETKLGDGYVIGVKVKKRFFDFGLNKSVVVYTSSKKQGNEFIHGFVGQITSPYFLANIANADSVAEVIRSRILRG